MRKLSGMNINHKVTILKEQNTIQAKPAMIQVKNDNIQSKTEIHGLIKTSSINDDEN